MFLLFFALWLLLAGEVTVRVCLWGAAASFWMLWFCRRVMGYRRTWRRGHLRLAAAGVRYAFFLLAEMLKAGFSVMGFIYGRRREMRPKLIWFDTTLKSEAAQAVLANSITLTAGTITVEAVQGRFCIHALDESLANGIESSEFQQRLEKMEA